MMAKRDMTECQFKASMKRHGFGEIGPMGYVRLPGTQTSVSVLNAGPRLRDILAYLIREQAKADAKLFAAAAGKGGA